MLPRHSSWTPSTNTYIGQRSWQRMYILAERYSGHWQVYNLPHSGPDFFRQGRTRRQLLLQEGRRRPWSRRIALTTIATQLVQKLPSLAPHVQNIIEADPTIPTKTLK
jgi:hypothetical protein